MAFEEFMKKFGSVTDVSIVTTTTTTTYLTIVGPVTLIRHKWIIDEHNIMCICLVTSPFSFFIQISDNKATDARAGAFLKINSIP